MVELGITDLFIGIGRIPTTVKPAVPKKLTVAVHKPLIDLPNIFMANRKELSSLIEELNSRSDSHVLSEHVPVPGQYAISLLPKDTVSHLHYVIHIMQRMCQCPFHTFSLQ
jgi:hypothetical protein